MAKELNLPHNLPIAWGRIAGGITFPRVLALCEMQTAMSRIWIHISISDNDNHYMMCISLEG